MSRPALLFAAACVAVLPFLISSWVRPATADPKPTDPASIYINVSGEAAAAKAWYDGAPPSGVSLQDALDKFNAEGFRIVKVTEPYVGSGGQVVWALLMER